MCPLHAARRAHDSVRSGLPFRKSRKQRCERDAPLSGCIDADSAGTSIAIVSGTGDLPPAQPRHSFRWLIQDGLAHQNPFHEAIHEHQLPHSGPTPSRTLSAVFSAQSRACLGAIQRCQSTGVRTIALGGHAPYSASGWVVEQAVGCIELIGAKVAGLGQMLLIGFTLNEQPAFAGFEVTATDAIGTLILPAHCFAAYVAIAAGQNTHFRIGGNGQLNAIGSDPSSLQVPSPM